MIVLLTWAAVLSVASGLAVPPKRYQCKVNVCVQEAISFTANGTSLSICQLTCGHGSLWPQPTQRVHVSPSVQSISIASISHSVSFLDHTNFDSALVPAMHANFLDILQSKAAECTTSVAVPAPLPLSISAMITTADERLRVDTNETYSLTVNLTSTPHVTIAAITVFGYRHALTTLSQLMEYDDISHTMQLVHSARIVDGPAFPHRGITLDTSRNFYSVGAIKRVLDGMSMTKLNTFHWHFTDTNSFPIEIIGEPRLTTYGAYSARQVYTQADIRGLVHYVIPELDAPAHVGAGWQWGHAAGLGDLVVCYDHLPWESACVQPPCGQLNPTNDEIFPILDTIYGEFDALFDADVVHMGGDEVHFGCWNMTDSITDGMASRESADFIALWGEFQTKAHALLVQIHNRKVPAMHKKVMIWTSDLTHPSWIQRYLAPHDYVIQIWDSTTTSASSAATFAKLGYHVVLSNYDKWYLDCGHGNWLTNGTSWCDPFKSWQVIYGVDMYAGLTPDLHPFVLGGESKFTNCIVLLSDISLWFLD
ncbi:hypothetical protein DYB36_010891 [Aphanomyces astaci]|uniref:beta-N-acetylhexosaminidase n=1 Tax=Aphanomyces astaci TaxID=112090 RepID=A0A396ZV24_APHAT|nr:hypothetical protein DYB36_010891 [Aphanomyces astaci]